MHNFKVIACDTDSIFFKKANEAEFSEKEIKELNQSLNSIFEKRIIWELNGYFKKIITVKAKNYILWDGKELKYKGSGLKSSKLEPALKEFLHKIIDSIIKEEYNYVKIYNSYVKEIKNLKDIKRWASKKTLTQTTYKSDRTNETKIIEAVEGTDYKEGDRIYTYYDIEDNLKLIENYQNDHNINRLLKRLFDVSGLFEQILPQNIFINYSLKRNAEALQRVV